VHRTWRALLTLTAIVVLGGSGGCVNAEAHGSSSSSNASSVFGADQTFVSNVQLAAPDVSSAYAATYEGLGRTICSDLQAGATIQQEVAMMHRRHLAGELSVGVIHGAGSGYCPMFSQALEEWGN
jgi:hypothetical protein